jgi:LysR family nitrogen assimilation transcriptional regulator
MELRQLRYFAAAVQAGTLTRAAEILHVAQPAVSQQILKLEEELGEVLLTRHSRGIEPTEAGALLMRHITGILQAIEVAVQDLRDLQGEPAGHVRLGLPRSVSDMLAATIFEHCRRKLPKVRLTIVERMSEDLNELLASARLDLAFSYNPEDVQRIAYDPLAKLDLFLVAPRAFVPNETTPDGIRFAALRGLPLVLPSLPHGLRVLLESIARTEGLALDVAHEVDSAHLLIDLVISGAGCTVLPYSIAKRAVASGSIVCHRIVEPGVRRTLHLARLRNRPLSRVQLALRDALTAIVGELIRSGDAEEFGISDGAGDAV